MPLSNCRTRVAWVALVLASAWVTLNTWAAEYPAPREASWVARDFRFHTGEVMPQVTLNYRTIGSPTGEPVLVLHGTAGSGSGASMLTPAFAGELFGPGQPLDATRYYIIIPDTIGHGKSSKPSDGLRTKFPKYNYDDMVDAHYRLLTEHLNVRHVRAIIGNSMGGMETWIFATKYPDYMDVAIPMACFPTEMSSRNWMLRRLITDSIRNDPDWKDGQYTQQPKSPRVASVFFGIATSGGNQALYKAAPTREKADALLEKIKAVVLAINAADDERNPPELGVMERDSRTENLRKT
jgi:homoserine O-acetyltransferase